MSSLQQKLKNIDFEKLYHFYLLYRERSIKQTAENHNIPIITLRHSLKTLEKKFGHKLYQTSKRAFIPTEEGKRLFKLSQDIIETVKSYHENAESKTKLQKEEFIIVTTTTIANYYLPIILEDFLKDYPHLHVRVHCNAAYVNVLDYGFDVLIAPKMNNVPLIEKKAGKFIYKFYCSRSLRKELGHLKSPFELKNQNLLLFAGEHYLDEKIINNNTVRLSADSYPLLLHACCLGQGILSCFSTSVFKSITLGVDIEELFPEYISEVDTAYFYYRRSTDKVELINNLFRRMENYLTKGGETT